MIIQLLNTFTTTLRTLDTPTHRQRLLNRMRRPLPSIRPQIERNTDSVRHLANNLMCRFRQNERCVTSVVEDDRHLVIASPQRQPITDDDMQLHQWRHAGSSDYLAHRYDTLLAAYAQALMRFVPALEAHMRSLDQRRQPCLD